jgi:hypothetical protein
MRYIVKPHENEWSVFDTQENEILKSVFGQPVIVASKEYADKLASLWNEGWPSGKDSK